jgi:hypothetical protein
VSCLGLFVSHTGVQAQGPGDETVAADSTESASASTFRLFSFWSDPSFSHVERILLFVVLGVAAAGLLYAYWLTQQIKGADQGTPKMQQIAAAIREGADAYLKKQLGTVAVMVILLVVVLFLTKALTSREGMSDPFAWGRALAFLMGAVFSALVGFVGMRLATSGNLRVAAAAKVGFGRALMLGYRTGTITGMLTDGLGLLGGTLIFMAYGEHAYEALLGFGFGGTLLALFMRVGGGIYTKAADVGADLVGKVEKDIPEDDPRNAAAAVETAGQRIEAARAARAAAEIQLRAEEDRLSAGATTPFFVLTRQNELAAAEVADATATAAYRRALKLPDDGSGSRIDSFLPIPMTEKLIRQDDVLLQVGSYAVGSDGTILFQDNRVFVAAAFHLAQNGENLDLKLWREGQETNISLPVYVYKGDAVVGNQYDVLPRYFVYGGLVFTPLSLDYLKTFGRNWADAANAELVYDLYYRRHESPETARPESVVLASILPNEVNANFKIQGRTLVDKINGIRIEKLEDVVRAFESSTQAQDVIEFLPHGAFECLDRAEVEKNNRDILQTYRVPKDRRL